MKVKDHLGNEFPTQKAMCEHYKIKPAAFQKRIERGHTLEEALTNAGMDFRGSKGKPCYDHNGKSFNSVKEMCAYWNVKTTNYESRRKLGWSIQDSLIGKPLKEKLHGPYCDPNGEVFNTLKDLCEHWNINVTTVQHRLRKPDQYPTLNEVLTVPLKSTKVKDHLGNEYESLAKMLEQYEITYNTYYYRKRKNYNIKEILTGKEEE